jgi:hypothetical protein
VATDDNPEARGLGDEIEGLEIVQDVDPHPGNLEGCTRGEGLGPVPFVDIAADGRDRGQGAEGLEDGSRADIPCVYDQVRPLKRLDGFRPQESVGIGDQADAAAAHRLEKS